MIGRIEKGCGGFSSWRRRFVACMMKCGDELFVVVDSRMHEWAFVDGWIIVHCDRNMYGTEARK